MKNCAICNEGILSTEEAIPVKVDGKDRVICKECNKDLQWQ